MSERNRKSSQYRVVGQVGAALLIALVVGCTKARDEGGGHDTSVSTAGTTDTTTLADAGLDEIPGRNPANTHAYLASLDGRWAPRADSVTLDCHDDDCGGQADTVHLLIYTHQSTYRIDASKIIDRSVPDSAQHVPGHIVLKMVNRDAFRYEPLGLDARDSAYLWVGKTNKRSGFAVFTIDRQGNAKGVARAFGAIRCLRPNEPTSSEFHIMPINACQPDSTGKEVLYSDPQPHGTHPKPPPRNPSGEHRPLHESGLWFSCTGGCCQANTFGKYDPQSR